MFRDVLCDLLRVSRASLGYRVTSCSAHWKRIETASIHTSCVPRYVAEHEGHELTQELDNNADIERISSNRNAYSDEDVARLKEMLAAGMTFAECEVHFPGRSYRSLRKRGLGWTKYYWSKHDHEQLGKGMEENLSDLEIQQNYLPSRTTTAIHLKRYRIAKHGITRHPAAWSEAELQTLSRLREEGKPILQIQEMALPHRSRGAIEARITKLRADQKLTPGLPSYGYTDEDIGNIKSLHSQGLDNAQIASKLHRTTASIKNKIIALGLTYNRTKAIKGPEWTQSQDKYLTPYLHKSLSVLEVREFLPHRTEQAIKSRMATLRRQRQTSLRSMPRWSQEDIAKFQAFQAQRIANNGSPTWTEISRSLGRTLPAVMNRVADTKRHEKERVKHEQSHEHDI